MQVTDSAVPAQQPDLVWVHQHDPLIRACCCCTQHILVLKCNSKDRDALMQSVYTAGKAILRAGRYMRPS